MDTNTKKFGDGAGNLYNTQAEASLAYSANPIKPIKAISADTIDSTTKPLNLPEPTPTPTPEVTLPETSPLDAERTRIQADKTQQESGISSLLKEMGIVSGKEATYADQLGAEKAQQEYDRYSSEIEAEKNSANRMIENIRKNNPTRALRGGQLDLIANIERESLAKQADLAILGNAAKGRFDTATSIAKRKVESELAPLKAEYDARKFIYDNNKELFSKAELTKLDALVKAEEKKINKEEERLTKGNEMIINALQFGAPQSVIDKTNEIIKKGGSVVQIAQSLGKYNKDIDMEVKKATIAKAWADAKKSDTTLGNLTEAQLKQIDTSPQGKKLVSLSGLYQKSQTYKNLLDTYGFKVAGAEKARLDQAYADLKIAYKEAANLGALTGPDVLLLEEAIKPASGATNLLNYKLSGGKAGVSSAIDGALSKARAEALQNFKQLTARKPEYRGSEYVTSLITPFAKEYSTVDVDNVGAGEIIQTEDGILLESLGGGKFSPL